MFYTFNQNNSGGFFEVDLERGITNFVIIEASSAEIANNRAEEIGLYFDGCDDDRDCSCCGDRWYRRSNYDGTMLPEIYGNEVVNEGTDVSVHYLDGTLKLFEQ